MLPPDDIFEAKNAPNSILAGAPWVDIRGLTSKGREWREGEKFIHHKAYNQYYNQNELMWQAARQEIPI